MTQLDSDQLADEFYTPLYRFALSLSRNEADAGDLVQQTFYAWAAKGHQLRDGTKVKTWLFTTLYRAFLSERRYQARFVQGEDGLDFVEPLLVVHSIACEIDAATLQDALHALQEHYRSPLTLFYMQQHSYREIAEILDIPLGTVMSRISRAKAELRKRLLQLDEESERRVERMRGQGNGS